MFFLQYKILLSRLAKKFYFTRFKLIPKPIKLTAIANNISNE